MITLDNVTYSYSGEGLLFEDYSLSIQRGERVAVLGPSGCGKSTLLYLIAGLRMPDKGNVQIDGQVLRRPRPLTGLILQEYGLLPWATVAENVALGLDIRGFYGPDGTHAPAGGKPSRTKAAIVTHWLDRLGIADQADKYPGQLSGGQRQRTAIARTLATNPDLLLMDEPFSSLDAATREDLQELTLTLCQEAQLTLVLVTHAIDESLAMGQRILMLGRPPHTYPQWNTSGQASDNQIVRKELVQWLRGV